MEDFSAILKFMDREILKTDRSHLRKMQMLRLINPRRKIAISKMRFSAIILFGFAFCNGEPDWTDSSCP